MKTETLPQEWQNIQNKQIKQLFSIVTGNLSFPYRPFQLDDLKPDLILRWRVPQQKFINKSQFRNIASFTNYPVPLLQKAAELAEKKIMFEMQKNKENTSNTEVKFRYMQSFQKLKQPHKSKNKVINDTGARAEEEIQFLCFDQKTNTLDGFTIYYNVIMYTLQKICGFKVRAFMVNTLEEDTKGLIKVIDSIGIDLVPQKPVRDIYLFLNLSLDNMLKVASKFQIKKELDYSAFDFYLNTPTTSDNRPISYNSALRTETERKVELQKVDRFFRIRQSNDISVEILQEKELSLTEYQLFRSYWEQSYAVFDFLKTKIEDSISVEEKKYIFEHNRGKMNPGCEKLFSNISRRRLYFQLQKDICRKYQYEVHDEPIFYQQFKLPSKAFKGGFFQKLRFTLKYSPNYCTPYGDLQLFNSMERTKLCYLMLKQTLKIDHLHKNLNIDMVSLNQNFEKIGDKEHQFKIGGGLDGTSVVKRWYVFGLFSDIRTIRNYFGDVIAHQIMIKIALIGYLFSISVFYGVLFLLEQFYRAHISLYSTLSQTAIFSISFNILIFLVQTLEDNFIKSFSDKRHSKVFNSQFKGPYTRNILTDELNQFKEEAGFVVVIRNIVCLVILAILGVAFGAVFYGCRMFLLEIHSALYFVQGIYFSLSHLCAYTIYFTISNLFQHKFFDKIVRFMLMVKNPNEYSMERSLQNFFTFIYLLVIELIPIIFFLVIEPFAGTSCYALSCQQEFYYYIYARFLFNIIIVGFRFAYILLFGFAKAQLFQDQDREEVFTVQGRLKSLIRQGIGEMNKSKYERGFGQDILSLFAFGFYCSLLPIAGIFAFGLIAVNYISIRMELLYQSRRPINKSEPIMTLGKYLYIIYFLGILINTWVSTFLLGHIQQHFQFLINMIPGDLTVDILFMIQLVTTVIFLLIIIMFGLLARWIISALSPKSLINRQYEKYRQYQRIVGGVKKKQNKRSNHTVIKTVFRSFNPLQMHHELYHQRLNNIDLNKNMQAELLYNMEIIKADQQKKNNMNGSKKKSRNFVENESNVRLQTAHHL